MYFLPNCGYEKLKSQCLLYYTGPWTFSDNLNSYCHMVSDWNGWLNVNHSEVGIDWPLWSWTAWPLWSWTVWMLDCLILLHMDQITEKHLYLSISFSKFSHPSYSQSLMSIVLVEIKQYRPLLNCLLLSFFTHQNLLCFWFSY